MPILIEDYVRTGKVKYIVRDYPLSGHDNAPLAARSTYCAADQEVALFWKIREKISSSYDKISRDNLLQWAEDVGAADLPRFQQCLDSDAHGDLVRADVLDGNRVGVESTPSFFLGFTDPTDPVNGQVMVLERIAGAASYSAFRHRLEFMLSEYERITSE